MYWQKRFDRPNPDKNLEEEITQIHIENKDYGYRRIYENYAITEKSLLTKRKFKELCKN